MAAAISFGSASEVARAAPSLEQVMKHFQDIVRKSVRLDHFYTSDNMLLLLKKYSVDELGLILQDFRELEEQTFATALKGSRDYLVTAGGPASGKSTVLEKMLEQRQLPHQDTPDVVRAYIDPDRSCLQRMQRTYLRDIERNTRTPQQAYEHWREASNFLSNVYLAKALQEGYAIAHGSTMATPYAIGALKAIKDQYGYKVTLVHMTCELELCKASESARRAKGVVQCTDKDLVEKRGQFLHLLPEYLDPENVHQVLFYYRSDFSNAKFVAQLSAPEGLKICEEEDWKSVAHIHNDANEKPEFWEHQLKKAVKVFWDNPDETNQVVPDCAPTSEE